MDVMSALLNYILTQREYYKELKGKYGDEADEIAKRIKEEADKLTEAMLNDLKSKQQTAKMLKMRNDKMQLPLKVVGNSFFGSYGAGGVFPWSDMECAEETTCTGRQMLRLMISHFTNIGYMPIVGDSFTPDTPLFIKYDDSNLIDIRPISSLINETSVELDVLGREYDYSEKNFKVLCRSGWVKPDYIYRHNTNKPIYRITNEANMEVDVTEDHSLFDGNKNKITPKEIKKNTSIEYYNGESIISNALTITDDYIKKVATLFNRDGLNELPSKLLNADVKYKKMFLSLIENNHVYKTKTLKAGIQYLKKCIYSDR
jgi:hypothetical protein